jgi:hypothetical protein
MVPSFHMSSLSLMPLERTHLFPARSKVLLSGRNEGWDGGVTGNRTAIHGHHVSNPFLLVAIIADGEYTASGRARRACCTKVRE